MGRAPGPSEAGGGAATEGAACVRSTPGTPAARQAFDHRQDAAQFLVGRRRLDPGRGNHPPRLTVSTFSLLPPSDDVRRLSENKTQAIVRWPAPGRGVSPAPSEKGNRVWDVWRSPITLVSTDWRWSSERAGEKLRGVALAVHRKTFRSGRRPERKCPGGQMPGCGLGNWRRPAPGRCCSSAPESAAGRRIGGRSRPARPVSVAHDLPRRAGRCRSRRLLERPRTPSSAFGDQGGGVFPDGPFRILLGFAFGLLDQTADFLGRFSLPRWLPRRFWVWGHGVAPGTLPARSPG